MIRASRLLAAAYTARALYMTASLALSYRDLRTEADRAEEEPSEETPGMTVIIPALREQAVMPRSLEHFAALAARWPTLRVLVVTAAREAAETSSGRPTTDDVCRNLAHQHNTRLGREVFAVVSYPGQGRRASQLNYAVAALDKLSPPAEDYVAVFDADAVPDARLASQFARAAKGRPAMIQQPMLPAFPGSSSGRRSTVMSGQDLAAFRRTLGIEYRRIRVARWCAPGRRPRLLAALARPMVYGVGSGLIVRRDKIEDIGFFQEPHDDLAVGHRLSMAGEPIAVLPSVNIVEPYQSVGAMARAFSSVAFANAATRHDYRFAKAHPTRLSAAGQRLLAARALADGAAWALGPAVMAAAAIHLVVRRRYGPLVAAALAAGLIEPVVAYRLRGRVLDDFRAPGTADGTWRQPPPAAAVATYMLQPAVSALGPWLLGVRASAAQLTGRELRFTKTEHLGEIAPKPEEAPFVGDLDIGWAVPTAFPETGWNRASIDEHLEQARGEIPAWDDPEQTRLGFAMAAPHPEAVRVLGDWFALNTNNVGTHTRFGEGKAGTRRLEKEALAVLAGLYRGGALDGHLTGGASEATLAALRIARNLLRADGHQVRAITSDLCHASVGKATEILDLDLVRLPAGPTWTLTREQVRHATQEAIAAGITGIIVVATAGYYNSGFADPVDEIAADLRDLAFQHPGQAGCFLHVDAAHGGFVFPFTAPDLPFDFRSPGVHSMAVDPHKAGLMPYACGALLVRKGLLEHVTRIDPHTRIPDETVLGSRPGATAAALWATLHTLGRTGYAALTTRCLEHRDQLTAAVRAADPDALLVPAPHAPVLSAAFSHPGGRLPPELCDRYRLVPLSLPDPHGGGTRLFYHFYASASLTDAQVTAFAGHLAAATAQARAMASDGHGSRRSITSEVVADTRTHTDCFRHFVVHPEGRRDPQVQGYSFHTFAHRRATGEQMQDIRWGEARADGDLWIYAPDLKNPFANELMGVRTEGYFLEVLDLHQQQLSLVGAIHATMLLPGPLRVLLNFEADGTFRSAEYKALGENGADELQIFPDAITAKIGKDAAGFLRPHSDDYSFSIDTSTEIRVRRTDGAAAPVVQTARHNADVLLPRRRHLRREQFRRFPNRFFDTELDIEAGRTWTGTAYLAELLAPTSIGTVLAARSATAGLCTVDGRVSDSGLHLALTALSEPRTDAVELAAPFDLGRRLHGALPRLDVRDPDQLGVEQVIDFAENVHEVFMRDGLPAGLVIAGAGR